jgi:hypothetical protein
MLFQGYERRGNQADPQAQLVKQEWAIQVKEDPPAEMAETAHRPPP